MTGVPRDRDIILEAINAYDDWMLDDDYEPGLVLTRIIQRMRDRIIEQNLDAMAEAGGLNGGEAEQTRVAALTEALQKLVWNWREYKLSVQSMEEAYYKLAKYAYDDWEEAIELLTENRVAPGNHPDAGQKDAKNPRAIYCLGCGNQITSGYVPWCDDAGCQAEKVKAYRRLDCDWEPRFHPDHAEGD